MTTYIPCVLTIPSMKRVIAHQAAAGKSTDRVTKAGLKAAIADGVLVEYISKSQFHRYGSYFTGAEAVAAFGTVGLEVRHPQGSLIAVVRYSAHPSFNGSLDNEHVGAVVS